MKAIKILYQKRGKIYITTKHHVYLSGCQDTYTFRLLKKKQNFFSTYVSDEDPVNLGILYCLYILELTIEFDDQAGRDRDYLLIGVQNLISVYDEVPFVSQTYPYPTLLGSSWSIPLFLTFT
jgi:hypothetical protein